jgi:hypothetical protein
MGYRYKKIVTVRCYNKLNLSHLSLILEVSLIHREKTQTPSASYCQMFRKNNISVTNDTKKISWGEAKSKYLFIFKTPQLRAN